MTYISNEHKFIFIEIPKTATTSINNSLRIKNQIQSSHCIKTRRLPEEDQRSFVLRIAANRHQSAYHIKYWDKYYCYINGAKMLDHDWSYYTSFSIIRNPWQRYASFVAWYFKVFDNLTHDKRYHRSWEPASKILKRNNFDCRMLLYDLVENRKTKTQEDFIGDYDNENLKTYNKNIIVSDLLRFENLQEDYAKLCKKLNIKKDKLNRENVCPPYNYKDFYNNELVDMVYEKEKRIIDMMNYTYD